MLPQTVWAMMALTGTLLRADSRASPRKNKPSLAMANGTREFASTLACREPKEEIISATAVIDTATGQARYDNYEGSWGDERHLHRFLQAYVVERSRLEARKKSYLTTEQSLADGSILVEIEVGGQA